MERQASKKAIQSGKTALGIELGSTRIKAVLIGTEDHGVLASGSFQWENRQENGLWTYGLADAVRGLQASYAALAQEVRERYGLPLADIGAIGVSGMMHGYLPLDAAGRQLAPFLTWRNTNTAQAADALTTLFRFNIPLRWSIAQLYQAILQGEPHVPGIARITTLAGWIHSLLSGVTCVGVGEASGMFPIDPATAAFDEAMLDAFDALIAERHFPWKIRDVLPRVLTAGACAGRLTSEGALLLDPTGTLRAGAPMAPPEGDAGTGMVATNAVDACTGNVSAGTSIFAMVVLERPLRRLYRDIDLVATPAGRPVAMVHCNNGASELDAWMRLFAEALRCAGAEVDSAALYERLFQQSLCGSADCGGVLVYPFVSGEPVSGVTEGRPMVLHAPGSGPALGDFMRAQLYSIYASLAVGMRILEAEHVCIRSLTGHGGLFKTPLIAQRHLAAALNAPVACMKTAGEGGPYGMAVLAAYLACGQGLPLETYLAKRVFADAERVCVEPDPEEAAGFRRYLDAYIRHLPLERRAAGTEM